MEACVCVHVRVWHVYYYYYYCCYYISVLVGVVTRGL